MSTYLNKHIEPESRSLQEQSWSTVCRKINEWGRISTFEKLNVCFKWINGETPLLSLHVSGYRSISDAVSLAAFCTLHCNNTTLVSQSFQLGGNVTHTTITRSCGESRTKHKRSHSISPDIGKPFPESQTQLQVTMKSSPGNCDVKNSLHPSGQVKDTMLQHRTLQLYSEPSSEPTGPRKIAQAHHHSLQPQALTDPYPPHLLDAMTTHCSFTGAAEVDGYN